MAAILQSESINELRLTLTHNVYTLYDALIALSESDTSSSHFQALEQCANYLETVKSSAQAAHLTGLQEICLFTQQHLADLDTNNLDQKHALCSELERLPRLIANYLYAPDDSTHRQQLMIYLQSTSWSEPINDDAIHELAEKFEQDMSYTKPVPVSTFPVQEDERAETKELQQTIDEESFPDDIADLSVYDTEETSSHYAFESLIKEDVTLPTTSKLETISETSKPDILFGEDEEMAIPSEELEDIELTTSTNGAAFDKLAEEDAPSVINGQNVNAVTDESELQHRLDEEIFGSEANEKEDLFASEEELLDFDENLEETTAVDLETTKEEHIEDLLFKDQPAFDELAEELPEAEPVKEEPAVAKMSNTPSYLSDQIVEASDNLSHALNQFMALDNESDDFLQALETYTNEIQQLWESAGKTNLNGLQTVFTFINDNVFELSAEPQAKRFTSQESFAVFPKLILDYLQTPDTGAMALVEHLRTEQWTTVFSDDELNNLLRQLSQDAIVSQIEETGYTAKLPVTTTPVVDKIEEKIPKEEEASAPADDVIAEEWQDAYLSEDIELAHEESEDNFLLTPLPVDEDDVVEEAVEKQEEMTATTSEKNEFIEDTFNDVFDDSIIDEIVDNTYEKAPVVMATQDMTDEKATVSNESQINADDLTEKEEVLPEEIDTVVEPILEATAVIEQPETEIIAATELATNEKTIEETVIESESEVLVTEKTDLEPVIEEALIEDATTLETVEEMLPSLETEVEKLEPDIAAPSLQLAEADILDILNAEIADATHELTKSLNKFSTVENDSPELLEVVEQYTDNVQSIFDAAEMANLTGLQEVCNFVNENIYELSTHAPSIRRTAQPHISEWTTLVQHYLQTPLEGAQQLVTHLSHPNWPLSLSEDRVQLLLSTLTNGILGQETESAVLEEVESTAIEEIEEEAVVVEEVPAVEIIAEDLQDIVESVEEETIVEEIQLASPDILPIVIGQVIDTNEELETTLQTLLQAEDGSEALLTSVESYTENVQALWDAAEMAQLAGLQEVCTFINDNIMALSMQGKAERQTVQPLLENWGQQVVEYLQTPRQAVKPLLQTLQDERWANPLDVEQAKALENTLLPTTITNEEVPSEEIVEISEVTAEEPTVTTAPIVLASPDILDIIVAQVQDSEAELQPILDNIVNAEEGSEVLFTEIENYTENVQNLWDAADMAQLVGLQEICTFINDNIMAFGMNNQATRQAQQPDIASWTRYVATYLTEPATGAPALINYLQQPIWATPLDDVQAIELKEKLIPATAQTVEEVTTSSTEQTIVEDIVLADPDILMLLIGQVEETTIELENTLTTIINANDGNEDLLMAVEAYTENVQTLWETADMAQLSGLQEVCTFINDNVMVLGTQDKAGRQSVQEIFASWVQFVLEYLQTPHAGAEKLVTHLQNPQWFSPLDEIQAQNLQQSLTRGSVTSTTTPTETTTETTAVTQDIVLGSPEIIELLRGQITDVVEGLTAALEVCVSMENDNPALLEAIEEYTGQVQAIWEAAEMAGLTGLQEVCDFVNENIVSFGLLEQAQKQAAQPYFAQWPTLVLEYLHSPLEGASRLTTFMQESGWPVPLDVDKASELSAKLTQSSTSAEQVAAYEQEVATTEEAVTVAAPEPVIEETPSEPLPELDVETPSGEISLGNAEVIEILQMELESAKEELAEELQKFTSLENGAAGFSESSENYTDHVQRLYAASEMVGLEGLQDVCSIVIENVEGLAEAGLAARQKAKNLLTAWPDLVLAYLAKPEENVISMLNHFRETQWAKPLADEKAHELLNKLTQGVNEEQEAAAEEEAYNRPKTATPEDVSLALPEDVNAELLEAYLQETPQHASDFSECIQNIISEPDKGEIERAKRIAHTLKGSSNIIGIKGIANIGHHLEDTLEYLAEHQVVPPKALTDTMVEAGDCLESMVDFLSGEGDPPDNAQSVLQQVLDWANNIDKGNLDAPAMTTPTAAPQTEGGDAKPAEKKEKTEKKATTGAPEQMLRVPTKTVDELMRLVGEMSISVGQMQERLKHIIGNVRVLTEQDLVLQKKTFELENLVDVKGISNIVGGGYRKSNENETEEEEFDLLEFEEYNELHSVTHSFIESIADSRELAMNVRRDLSELETMFVQHERLNKEFQSTVMTTRMVPVATIAAKLQRNIRQTCRMTGKKADLELSGVDIMMDSDVLNNLADPLMHILRNSVDHGIEASDERTILGKPESGTIDLRFYREGNNIVVSCQDDGQGLNYTNIRYTAIQRGLITESQDLTEQELARLILMSGFSTKSGVTQVSGRGVGMDVVHTNIRQMKGTLDLFSETGKGTSIIIKLPMTLVTVHVLVVKVGHTEYGIPTNTLLQVLAPGSSEFQPVGDEINLKMGKNLYPIKALSGLLNVASDYQGISHYEHRPILLVKEETGITAVLVDDLVDTHDLVMKSMGKYVRKVRGVVGASILGDGSLVPLLDLPELLRSPMQAVMSSYIASTGEDEAGLAPAAAVPTVMIVDDSLSVRKSLSILVEDAGFDTLLAKDGLEAIELMGQTKPNVMLVDMEMPRMNGLELTAHVRANQATDKTPIFMITSRTTEKHREQAKTAGVSEYLTKPYQDTELLDLIDKALAGGYN